MIVRLKFNPKTVSYQFLYEIALYETKSSNLDEIYETICLYELRASDCSDYDCSLDDIDCTALGVKRALATNPHTSSKTMLKLAKESDGLLRAIVAIQTEHFEVMNLLVHDSNIHVVKNLLENPYLTRKCYQVIYKNYLNDYYDFSADYNKRTCISKRQFGRFLTNHIYATESVIKNITTFLKNNK